MHDDQIAFNPLILINLSRLLLIKPIYTQGTNFLSTTTIKVQIPSIRSLNAQSYTSFGIYVRHYIPLCAGVPVFSSV